MLRRHVDNFCFCVLDDGSRDETAAVLARAQKKYPELYVVTKENSGHGQTCVAGYTLAVQKHARWILQIDSDGQCDPCYFADLWRKRLTHPVVYGYRYRRDDGLRRWLISRVVSCVAWAATQVWVADANVPYRLMRSDHLAPLLPHIPKDFYLANVLLSVLQQKNSRIAWCNIHFRNRASGTPSVSMKSMVRHGAHLATQLRGLT